jgi:hypothetical protein
MNQQHCSLPLLSLFLLLESCSTAVKGYEPDYLLPTKYVSILKSNSVVGFSTAKLCEGFQSEWDSILVIKPYTRAATVSEIKLNNFSSVAKQVESQSISDATCTLLFVKNSKYVSYSVFPRRVDLTSIDKGTHSQILWLTKSDCNLLVMRKISSSTNYSISLIK